MIKHGDTVEMKVHHCKSSNTKRSFFWKKKAKRKRRRKYIYSWIQINKESFQIGVKHQKVVVREVFETV